MGNYNRPMKILHVGKYYPPFLGGMETVLENQVLGLLEAGQEVAVLVAGTEAGERRNLVASGPGTATLTRLARLGVLNSQPLTPGLFSALRRLLVEFRPDVVHLHLPNPLLAAAWLAQPLLNPSLTLPPLAVWHHADITRQRWGRMLVGPVNRRCLAAAGGISVAAPGLAAGSRDLARHLDRVQTIPFGIPAAPWDRVRSDFSGPFLFIGRLVPYKGLEVLLQAMAELPAGELVLVGDGPLRGKLANRIVELGLQARVRLAGRLERPRVLELMGEARGLVLPSLDCSETFGLVQLEAMAAGLPVIASDLPTGIREVGVPDETCLLVEPGRADELACCLGRILDEPGLGPQLGAAGRRRFQEHFTRTVMIDNLLAWYRSLLARPGGKA